jgi:SAM-dependent methyltransferase
MVSEAEMSAEASTPLQNPQWANGEAYEPYVGRWSRLVAREFLAWLAIPAERRWLDVGCGTGALSQTILTVASPIEVKAIDRSEGYLDYARQKIDDKRISFQVGDAQLLPIDDETYDVAVSGLVLNFVPEPQRMVAEMARCVKPGGQLALYVWDYADKMEVMRYFFDAATALNPAAIDQDEGRRFPICKPEPLRALFNDAGLQNVEARAIDVPTDFRDFDDYWSPFLGGQGVAPAYAMSLSEEDRAALREHLRASLPVTAEGTIHLITRAWAVKGTKK